MRLRFRWLVLFLGGDIGDFGRGRAGICATSASGSGSGSCTTACCEGGGVLGATLVAVFCCIGAMSTNFEVNSWPSIGLRLSNNLRAMY